MFNTKVVEPTRIDLDTKFKFRCHKAIKCFTKCCSNIDIMLTPYDILRMKNRLQMSSEEFLEKHTFLKIDEKSSHPYVYLKMNKDEKRSCPFLRGVSEGCSIYTDRPVSCRYYPVGQATLKKQQADGIVHEEFYFFVREQHCLGYQEDNEWTVESWRIDQKASLYDEMNREWKSILMRRNIPGQSQLDPKKQTQFYMTSYDLDKFKRYVFESKFLDIFDLTKEEIENIRNDEVALMRFAFKYLKNLLMMEEALKVKPEVIKERSEKK